MRKKLTLLLIEDDEIERMKFGRICNKHNFNCIVEEANNGEVAFDVLKKSVELPNLILLDLNMPKMNGFEFLKKVKAEDHLRHIPITIMSSSDNYEDIKKAYDLGATGYMLKPLRIQDYEEKIVAMYNYWKNNELVIH